jgi:hypothetical protein
MRAIETTGSIEKSGQLKLDKPLRLYQKQKVKIIILFNEENDIDEKLWLASLRGNPAFAFLNDKSEDIYSVTDGKKIKK